LNVHPDRGLVLGLALSETLETPTQDNIAAEQQRGCLLFDGVVIGGLRAVDAASTKEGHAVIDGSINQHAFRFPQILDWMRQHIKPVSWLVFHHIVAVINVDVVLVIIMVMIMVMGVPIIAAILPPVGVPIMGLRNLQNSHRGHLVQARHGAQPDHHAVEPRSGGRERVPVLGEVNRRRGSALVQNVGLPVARMFRLGPPGG